MKDNILKNVEKLIKVETSEKKMLSAFNIFKPTHKNWKKYLCIIAICLVPAFLTSTSPDTVTIFSESLDAIFNVTLALFGIIFTGYAFFQALVNDELLLDMLEEDNIEKSESKLQETNEFFVESMMRYVLAILLLLLLKLTILAIPKDWILVKNIFWSNVIAGIFIEIYYVFNVFILWETKSFIFNVFQLFNAHAIARVIEILDNDKE